MQTFFFFFLLVSSKEPLKTCNTLLVSEPSEPSGKL